MRLHDQLRVVSVKYNNEASMLRHLIDATRVTVTAVDRNRIITTMNDASLYLYRRKSEAEIIWAHYSN